MDTRLTIDSEDVRDLAAQLADLTGESVTDAVTRVLRTELKRQRRERDIEAKAEHMMAIGREIRARIKGPISSDTRDMYDENGLPR